MAKKTLKLKRPDSDQAAEAGPGKAESPAQASGALGQQPVAAAPRAVAAKQPSFALFAVLALVSTLLFGVIILMQYLELAYHK